MIEKSEWSTCNLLPSLSSLVPMNYHIHPLKDYKNSNIKLFSKKMYSIIWLVEISFHATIFKSSWMNLLYNACSIFCNITITQNNNTREQSFRYWPTNIYHKYLTSYGNMWYTMKYQSNIADISDTTNMIHLILLIPKEIRYRRFKFVWCRHG